MVAEKKTVASRTPATEDFPLFQRRYHGHSPDAGKNESREVLVKAATPQSRPKAIHILVPSNSSSFSASQKMSAKSSAARLVSHTQRVLQYITVGSSAHPQAVHTATFSLKHLRAIRKIGMQVRAEKMLLRLSRMRAEALV